MQRLMANTVMCYLTAHGEWQGHDERCNMNNNSANVFLNAAGKLISTLNLFFVITKTCNQICLFHSLLLIHILDQKYLDGKPVIDRNVISIPKAPAQLITVPPNLLDAVQCEKNIYI